MNIKNNLFIGILSFFMLLPMVVMAADPLDADNVGFFESIWRGVTGYEIEEQDIEAQPNPYNRDLVGGSGSTGSTLGEGYIAAQRVTGPIPVAMRVLQVLLTFLGIGTTAIIIYAGVLWLISGGESQKVTLAKQTLTRATIGLIIILSSWGITVLVIRALAGDTYGGAKPVNLIDPSNY